MRQRTTIVTCLAALILLGCGGGSVDPTRVQSPIRAHSNSVEFKLLRTYTGKSFRCVDFAQAGPGLNVVSYLRYAGPILGKLNGDPVVSAKIFSSLTAVSVRDLKPGQPPRFVGVAVGLAKRKISAGELITWLLEAGIVRVMRHFRTSIIRTRLRQRMDDKIDLYFAQYQAHSEIFTSVRTVEISEFAFKIDRNTGQIWVGLPDAFKGLAR